MQRLLLLQVAAPWRSLFTFIRYYYFIIVGCRVGSYRPYKNAIAICFGRGRDYVYWIHDFRIHIITRLLQNMNEVGNKKKILETPALKLPFLIFKQMSLD